jgi:RHS repeat-associated protein
MKKMQNDKTLLSAMSNRRSRTTRIGTGIALVATFFGSLHVGWAAVPATAGEPSSPASTQRAATGRRLRPIADRAAPATAAGRPPAESPARPDDTVPELWTPRTAVLLDGSSPLGAESLFDGDATTGFTIAAGKAGTVRLELGSAREVIGLGVHGTGQAKIGIYAEDDKGARTPISTGRDGAINLEPDRWAQVAPARPTKTSALVVQWTVSPTAPATVTELALWVGGRSRQALAEAAIADRLVTGLPENAVAATAVPWTASVARITPQGPVSASFTVKVNGEPRLGRAFLVYELEKKAHWTGVARSINGHVVRGGYRAEANGLGGVQVEEINPAWLTRGENKISFEPTVTEDGRGYSISNVRVVSVPRGIDPGRAAGPRSPLSDGDLATGVGGPGVHGASVSVPADREPAFLSFHLDKPTRGMLTVSADGGRARKGKVQVDLEGRPVGWQTVPVAGVLPTSSELRVRVVGDKESTAQVSEARILGFPALASNAQLAVSYPLHGECADHKTHVRGFVSGPGRLQKPQFFVDGAPAAGRIDPDGSFEADVKEPAAAKGKQWSIRLEVATEGGARLTRTVPVDTCVEPPKKRIIGVSPPVEDVGAPYGAVVSPGKASTLEFAGAKIEVPAGAVESDVRVTMRALDRGQLHPIEAEMDNVTASGGALRFGPHGLKFKRPVEVTLPVDASRMPQGMTNGDVVTFYYDEASGKWRQLPKVSGRDDRTVGQTTHFTDFIAATVKTPDHPDAQQFNPNTMKNVKVGEPAAGITLIEPPQANSSGSASLNYPIETPPGRNGIGPSLALTYNSDRVNSNGWLGVGWDLRLSSIEIDTRFGVPKYDGTDIYSLDGAMLAPTAPAGTYIRRVEGPFDLIKRQGTGPTTYSWTVTDKRGTVYTYGTVANSRLANLRITPPVANTFMAPQGAIFRWYLERVQDTFGNVMTITYTHDTYTSGAETYDEVYPSAIDYTSNGSLAANYHVTFTLDSAGTRPDTMITARSGFLVSTRRRLTNIKVKSGTTLVRQYRFEYLPNLTDTMQKSVLAAVALWGVEDTTSSELYRHTFEYNKAPATSEMFSPQRQWGQLMQAAPQGGYAPRTGNGLSHSVDKMAGGNVLFGFGFPELNATGSFGMDFGSSVPDLAFVGLTGEGLPDQVDTNGILSLNTVRNVIPFDQIIGSTVTGLSRLGATHRPGFSAGGNLSALGVFGAGVSYNRHVSNEFGLVTDINGDGFPDVAYQSGNSVFASVNDGNRNFTQREWTGYSLEGSAFSTADRVIEAGTAAANAYFKTDPLMRWVAPFAGTVTVTATAAKAGAGGDPIRIEFYVVNDTNPANDLVNSVTLTDQNSQGTLASNLSRMVSAGDRIYFRLVAEGGGVSDGAQVTASIVYTPPSGRSTSERDPTGSPIFSFHSSADLRAAGPPNVPWRLTGNGDIAVARCFWKYPTADNVKVSYVIRDKNNIQEIRRFDKEFAAAAAAPYNLELPFGSPICFDSGVLAPSPSNPWVSAITNVLEDQNVALEVTSDTPIDPRSFFVAGEGAPTMRYTRYCRLGVCGVPQQAGSDYVIPGDPHASFSIPATDIAYGELGEHTKHYYQARVQRIFNSNNPVAPNPLRSVARPAGTADVTFGGTISLTAALTADAVVIIQGIDTQGVGKLYKKVKIPAGTPAGVLPANLQLPAGSVPVATGDRVFFTIHHPTIIGGNVSWTPTMTVPGSTTTVLEADVNRAILDATFDNNPRPGLTSRDPMSGGFRRWFYGDWNDLVPFSDSLIVRKPNPPQNAEAVMGMLPGEKTLWIPWEDGVSREFRYDLWHGRGGAGIDSNVVFRPGRVGNAAATATTASGMAGLRVSDTWNVNVNANVTPVSVGVNGGDATTQVDFFDFNGDRFPDSVTRTGIQLNDGTSRFSSRQIVDMNIGGGTTELRRILNVSLQAGVSVNSSDDRQLITESEGDGTTKRISAMAALSGSADYGVSSTRIDFADVNGDGLIDHVRQEPGDAAMRVRLNLGYGFSNEVSWGSATWAAAQDHTTLVWQKFTQIVADPGTMLNKVPGSASSTNVVRVQDTATLGDQLGGNLEFISGGGGPSWSVTRKWSDLLDVNGDGMPDKVLKIPGEPFLRVKLNTGVSFATEKTWTLPDWTTSAGPDFSFLAPPGLVTPDGLGFSAVPGWGKNLSFKICIIVCVGGSGFESRSSGGPSADFEDIDGDGKLDQVMKVPGDARIYTKLSNIGKTNLLSAVNRPLAGRIDISYARSGNHVDLASNPKMNMPSNQWVMSSVIVNADNRYTCPNANCTTETYDYSNWLGYGSGYYDFVEREDLGYQNVKTRFPLEDQGTSIATVYSNQNYYVRGLEQYKYWYQNDTNGVLLRSTRNIYTDPDPNKNLAQLPARTGTYFPANTSTYTNFWEASNNPNIHLVGRAFDTNGNLTDVVDYGDQDFQGFTDDFNYHIDYQQIGSTITVPKTITVRSGTVLNTGTLLAKRTAAFTTRPKPDSVTDVIAGGKHPVNGGARTATSPASSTWSFTYDAWGNVQTAVSPNGSSTTDSDGSARTLTYTYDATTRTYPATTSWSDGSANPAYSASAVYDLRFGVPSRIIDVAGAKQEIDYDDYGRITKVFAPNDFNATGGRIDTNAPTIAVSYSTVAHTGGTAESVPAWAMAAHQTKAPAEGSLPSDPLPPPRAMRTVNFVDGLNRSIQVKKDISRDDASGTPTAVMSVSGKTIFDARGRVYQQGQPTWDTATTPTWFIGVSPTNATQYAYDVLGRLRQEQHPDNGTTAVSTISYQKGTSPKDGREWIVKITSDPKHGEDTQYHYRTEYRTARDVVMLVAERNQINGVPTDLFTSYEYDPLGRVTKVRDATSNETTASYDTVGNLVSLTSPDAGTREWRYCVGGYVCAEQSPLMVNTTNKIQYAYDRDRLMSITYPSSGNGAVNYTYGTSNEKGTINADGGTGYKANRVTRRTDEAGQFDYNYDALGNVNSDTALLKKQTVTGNYQSYQTQYKWDNFGRLIDVTIPSTTTTSPAVTFPAETIRYGYDAGGAVTSARGRLTSSPNTTFHYVKHVGYNEFGERVRITYGNDAFSTYSYAPDTRRLALADTTVKDIASEPERKTQQLFFYYDLVGNVTVRWQTLALDAVTTDLVPVGGVSLQWFGYDPLNQLTRADLYIQGSITNVDYGSVILTYDEIGNIAQKEQSDGGDVYDLEGNWIYSFTGSKHYNLTPHFNGTAAGSSPHAPSTIDEDRSGSLSTRVLTYNKNGNVTKQVHDVVERRLTWTDTDRIRSICEVMSTNCPPIAQSWYTADGTRALHKVTQNGSTSEGLYVNQYLTVRNGNLPTKHVFLGDAAVASKVETGATTSKTYWYHSDHLQSTQYVTTNGQVVAQHLEYFPGGEIFREQAGVSPINNIAHARTFTAKELDPSGYYYFGARYYEPSMQMWLSPDPILASYMQRGPAGASPKNLGLYSYSWNNPVVMRDPDGRQVLPAHVYDRPGHEGETMAAQGMAARSLLAGVWNALVGAAFGGAPVVPYAAPGFVDYSKAPGEPIVDTLSVPNDTLGNIGGAVVLVAATGRIGGGKAAPSNTVRVGRWMGQAEQDAMIASGRAQESTLNGVTSVSKPPDPSAWAKQTSGANYVEFDVASSAVRGAGTNSKIYGPNSIFGPTLNVTEMPPATNIVQTACKVPLRCN